MTPKENYIEKCRTGLIVADPIQLEIIDYLNHLYLKLIDDQPKKITFLSLLKQRKSLTGIYLWGTVGVGKTFLMDCFFECLPAGYKKRMHFHAFMHWVHAELKKIQGQKNPLQIIAKALVQQSPLLCFDELIVTDIADAMILAKLFDAMFAAGITVVLTSNTKPEELYLKGLQRSSFLPAIDLIKKHTQVIHIPTTQDYRVRELESAGVFFTPIDDRTNFLMEKLFQLLSANHDVFTSSLFLNDRKIPIRKRTEHIIWFDFQSLCHIPRSQKDYLSLAKSFHTIFLSNIPVIHECNTNSLSLFIKLIDVLYDHRIRLVFSAVQPISDFSTTTNLVNDFKRTKSRLQEMQSHLYFSHVRL